MKDVIKSYEEYIKEHSYSLNESNSNDNNKTEGDYKLENYEWQWYPL